MCLYLHYENTKLQVSNYNIVNDKIPNDFNNYKIFVIQKIIIYKLITSFS